MISSSTPQLRPISVQQEAAGARRTTLLMILAACWTQSQFTRHSTQNFDGGLPDTRDDPEHAMPDASARVVSRAGEVSDLLCDRPSLIIERGVACSMPSPGLNLPPETDSADWILDMITCRQLLPNGQTLAAAYQNRKAMVSRYPRQASGGSSV